MGPIELFFLTIGIIILLIGLVRGYVKELGNTIVLMSAVFIISFVYFRGGERIDELVTSLVAPIFDTNTEQAVDVIMSTIWSVIFIAIVFASYAGVTLEFPGKRAKPPVGTILDFLIGALNGYLVAGTLWFIQDTYDYPIQWVVDDYVPVLTETAQKMVEYLPPVLFPSPVYWIIPVAILLIWAIRK